MLTCVQALRREPVGLLTRPYKMMGPSSGTFSVPNTSISLKKDVMADCASLTSGLCVHPNGIVWIALFCCLSMMDCRALHAEGKEVAK